MCLWPLCFIVTCQSFLAKETCWKAPLLFCLYAVRGHRAKSWGRLKLSTPTLLLQADLLTENKRFYTWYYTLDWSSSHRRICIDTVRVLMHSNICTGVGNCQFLFLIVLCYALAWHGDQYLLVNAVGGWECMHEGAAEWTHVQVKGPISPDTALLLNIEWLWIAVSALFRGITMLLTSTMVFLEVLACWKHIVRTPLGNKCVFFLSFSFSPLTQACVSENVTHSVNRSHASAV